MAFHIEEVCHVINGEMKVFVALLGKADFNIIGCKRRTGTQEMRIENRMESRMNECLGHISHLSHRLVLVFEQIMM